MKNSMKSLVAVLISVLLVGCNGCTNKRNAPPENPVFGNPEYYDHDVAPYLEGPQEMERINPPTAPAVPGYLGQAENEEPPLEEVPVVVAKKSQPVEVQATKKVSPQPQRRRQCSSGR